MRLEDRPTVEFRRLSDMGDLSESFVIAHRENGHFSLLTFLRYAVAWKSARPGGNKPLV